MPCLVGSSSLPNLRSRRVHFFFSSHSLIVVPCWMAVKPITPLNYSLIQLLKLMLEYHCIEEGRSSHNSANEGESESKKINRLNSLENGSRLRDGNGFNIFILTTNHPSATTTSFAGYSIKMAKDEEVEQSNKQFILLDLLMRYRSIFIRGHHYHGSHRFRSEYLVIDHEQPVGAPFGIYCHLNTRKYK